MGLDDMAYKCKAVAMYAWHRTLPECAAPLDNCIVSKDDEFCIEKEKLCIKNEDFCINNDELCRFRRTLVRRSGGTQSIRAT